MGESALFSTILVANRGEIAVRVMRTLRALGIRSVAVYSDADRDARHVREADTAVHIGPAPARQSYLSVDKIIAAAKETGAQAIHPGYGFLSENTAFAAACAENEIAFLGPSARAIEVMGDKITAKNAVIEFGVPVVPGIAKPGLTDDELIAAADEVGYPVLVKPSAGGGGKGMRRVEDPKDLPEALRSARREAGSAFGDDTLFLERFVTRPRHIEVQVLADTHGTIVHLGERECSLQRRHQKVIEEAPSPLLDEETRAKIGEAACNTARSVDYTGAGTVEFIVSADKPDEFFFMEMNTRLQVEHPVTELVTGVDLVEWQVRIAAGENLGFAQEDVTLSGHAIEARVYAEDPGRGFLPTGGTVLGLNEPSSVRVDSGLRVGTVVGSDYDPMLSKVIAHAADRATALHRLDRALASTAVLGVGTNIEFLRFLLADEDVKAGRLDTALLDRRLPDYVAEPAPDLAFIAAAVSRWLRHWPEAPNSIWDVPTGWRVGEPVPYRVRLTAGDRTDIVKLTGTPELGMAVIGESDPIAISAEMEDSTLLLTAAGRRHRLRVAEDHHHLWFANGEGAWSLQVVREASVRQHEAHRGDAEILSPMPGTVIAIHVASGDDVAAGTPVVVVEAMKMEHTLTSPVDGTVVIHSSPGDQVSVDQLLARVTASATPSE
ncbi:acetyl/propionyl/methylcrotonyl-CoA carboxylase subunit alpha [Hoyosella altamirensis]|uniref:Biotin-dependent 3-methylcrotonyl-coenzyme A carboxylase alpha1 subunit n=1 Tax=Hoyosella altamirensis TaxID=616997 RepID=A0A839RNK4_9ACTN|nr:acetyl/propionyl/methylcrotonyl-CoA carboxylase subunit alpha [Hoyosella altamirensis]MBB3038355.1 acetyl-CoA/propionyl-CoA carboxylase biotin carboxyl carrier protein [Hoyosella altamirensis]